jgi:hypothetical protein
MVAAKECPVLFESVTYDTDAAVLAVQSQRVDRALEAVEGMGLAFMLTWNALS